MKKLLTFALLAVSSISASANLAEDKKVFSSGNWAVLRGVDAMTDKVTCTGIYKKDYAKQLVADRLFVSVRGGISSVTLRFDDEPAQSLRLATDTEKNINSVIINDAHFDALIRSSRLRMQVLTLVSGVQNIDLDLKGIADAVENIRADCPDKAPSKKKS